MTKMKVNVIKQIPKDYKYPLPTTPLLTQEELHSTYGCEIYNSDYNNLGFTPKFRYIDRILQAIEFNRSLSSLQRRQIRQMNYMNNI